MNDGIAPLPFVTRSMTSSFGRLGVVEIRPDVARGPGVGQGVARAAVRREDRLPVGRLLGRDARSRQPSRRRSRCRRPPDPGRRRRSPMPSTSSHDGSVVSTWAFRARRSTGLVIGYWICVATTWVNVSEVIPASRACAKASSRFGPTVPFVPASASVWQPPHAWTKSFLPGSLAAVARCIRPCRSRPERRSSAPAHATRRRRRASRHATLASRAESPSRRYVRVASTAELDFCSCFSCWRTLGAVGSSGASFRNALKAAIIVVDVVRRLRGLGELELDARVVRVELRDLAVLLDRLRRGCLALSDAAARSLSRSPCSRRS